MHRNVTGRWVAKYFQVPKVEKSSLEGTRSGSVLIGGTSVWNAIRRKLYPREGFIPVSPVLPCTTSESEPQMSIRHVCNSQAKLSVNALQVTSLTPRSCLH